LLYGFLPNGINSDGLIKFLSFTQPLL
jgi:hypothetical protein